VESDLEQLFCEAYYRLHGRLLDHAERFLDREAARDAAAEAMAQVWYRWPMLTAEQRGDPYFFRAVHNNVIDALKADSGLVSLEDAEPELEQLAASAEPDQTGRDTAADVLDATLAAMPRRRREVFLLVREECLTYKEAAEALGLSESTINTHMHLAAGDLRAAFTRAGFRIANAQPARLPSPKGGATND
jgi:RNA polymerase sigma-70 factor (ECF subfamily)